ncbi:Sua5/YciO/YrdC/YwlC family protein [Saccharothrix sp.]|uniref:L-threonylcarbamoyladenylate synthase n=1 Tax=Saccharothrix sp. TaxID=1873460 RepID=UPI002810A5A5|nr:Sua5/YciO/YrdC/YwlC family protein [Saccharothrix sp.]
MTRDLGETHGTVAMRMSSHPMVLGLLAETGPMVLSSANLTGQPSPQDCDAAQGMLGDPVAVYLDGGPTAAAVAFSIVDLTGAVPVLTRAGAITGGRWRPTYTPFRDPRPPTPAVSGRPPGTTRSAGRRSRLMWRAHRAGGGQVRPGRSLRL